MLHICSSNVVAFRFYGIEWLVCGTSCLYILRTFAPYLTLGCIQIYRSRSSNSGAWLFTPLLGQFGLAALGSTFATKKSPQRSASNSLDIILVGGHRTLGEVTCHRSQISTRIQSKSLFLFNIDQPFIVLGCHFY